MKMKLNFAIVGFLLICAHFNQIFEQNNMFLTAYKLTTELIIVIILGCILVNNVTQLEKHNTLITLGLVAILYVIGSFFANQISSNWTLDINIVLIYSFELVYLCVCGYYFMKIIKNNEPTAL